MTGPMLWQRGSRDKAVVARFVEAVRARDLPAIRALMADDFTYIDSWREGVTGRERVMAVLAQVFADDPEFGIEVDRIDWRDPFVLMTGRVNSRSFGMGRRAVWQVEVRKGRLVQWQAWAEGGPPPMSRLIAGADAEDMRHRASDRPEVDAPNGDGPSERADRSFD